jgi:hypothetical protein
MDFFSLDFWGILGILLSLAKASPLDPDNSS